MSKCIWENSTTQGHSYYRTSTGSHMLYLNQESVQGLVVINVVVGLFQIQ